MQIKIEFASILEDRIKSNAPCSRVALLDLGVHEITVLHSIVGTFSATSDDPCVTDID